MFCSKCGKTLPYGAEKCEFCSKTVGESRFEGSPYTSAQDRIYPGDDVPTQLMQNYTRTSYFGNEDISGQGEPDSRTTYRPVYGDDIIPDEIRRGIHEAVHGSAEEQQPEENEPEALPENEQPEAEEAEDFESTITYDDIPEEFRLETPDMSRFRAKPIQSAGQSGISEDLSQIMSGINADAPRRAFSFGRRRAAEPDVYEDEAYAEAEAAEYAEDMEDDQVPPADVEEQSEVFDDIDEEYFDEMRHSTFGVAQLLKIVVAFVAVAALIVGGVMWFNYIRGRQSGAPIENVNETLYTEGIALIESHASTENVEKVLTDYAASNSNLASLQTQLTDFSTAVNALTPAEATENELIFMDALKKIETNISNCIISDAIAVGSNDAASVAESDDRWQVVTNSIGMLKTAKSTAELTAIINGEVVDVKKQAEVTPTPEPAVNYNTLSKGDKSPEVLDMQNRLIELGYLNDTPDGAFGAKTQTAVKIFQQVMGLPVTGIADNATLNAIYADDAPRAGLTNNVMTTPAPTDVPPAAN